jgi:ABC-2 type transport system ATP-binding protein
MTPVIRFHGVRKQFGRVTALDNLSFEVPPGRVCALLGANGAGKTTAIRILLGLERADAGRTEVLGMDSTRYGLDIRRRVGYVAERPTLYEWMTIDEIGWFAAGFYPPGYQRVYAQYVERFELDGRKVIKTLSKGMRAKVALSLSLAHRPDLLILDEPTSGLDPLVRREFLESMVDIASEGRTVLLSSHQVAEVERVADMVVILQGGKLVCIEALDDLKRTTREVVVTLADASTPPPAIPGDVLAHVQFGHEHVWMVRNLDEAQLAHNCRHAETAPYQVRSPSLEDILLALLREYRHPGKTIAAPAAVAATGIS